MDATDLHGMFCPVATPLTEGTVDVSSLTRQIERIINAGISGFVVCGTTGEFASLTPEERATVIETVVENTPAAGPVLAGTASTTVDGAVNNIQVASQMGADGVLLPPPFFHGANEPEGVREFFERVLNQTTADVILYNIPQCVGQNIPHRAVVELAEYDEVVGLKESGGDLGYALDIRERTNEEFAVVIGSDRLVGAGLAAGVSGGINGLSNLAPSAFSELYRSASAGEMTTVKSIYSEHIGPFRELCGEHGYVPTIKAVLSEKGIFATKEVRPPLVAPSNESITEYPDIR